MGLSQSEYVDKILKLFKMQDTKRGFFPIPHDTILSMPHNPSPIDEQIVWFYANCYWN